MATNGQPPAPTTHGYEHAVPCPFCGKNNDFRDTTSGFAGQQMGDEGDEVHCDHCGNVMKIVAIKKQVVVYVRQHKIHRQQAQAQQQRLQRPQQGGFLKKLLGR